jgi:CARDB protein
MPHTARSVIGMGFRALLVVLAVASGVLVNFRSHAAEQAAFPTTPRLRKGKALTATRGSNRSLSHIFDVKLPPPDLRNWDETNFSAVVGLLRPRERESKKFILPKLANVKALVAGDSTLRYEFRAPSGRRLALGVTPNGGDYKSGGMGGLRVFFLEQPEAGEWSVTVDATKSSDSASYGIVISSDGPVEEQGHLEAITRDSPEPNAPVRPGTLLYVRAFVLNGDRPVPGVEWNVTARTPEDSLLFIPVFDDGLHADGAANDGIHVGVIDTQGPDGLFQFGAEGKTPGGVRYFKGNYVEVQAKYDLLISGEIAVSPNPRVGKPVTLTATVKNDGHHDYRNLKLGLFLRLGSETWEEEVSRRVFDIKAGESRRIVTKWTPTSSDNYEVRLTIDPYLEPDETDYANNTRKTTVRVR